jgi:hypothetical protein
MARVTGSGAFVAAARATWIAAKEMEIEEDEEGKSRLVWTGRMPFLPAKNNLGDSQTGFAYRIVEKPAIHPLRAPAIEWDADPVTHITADEALAGGSDGGAGGSSGADKASAFLKKYLADGPRLQKQIVAAGSEQGLSEDQLKRAKKKLGLDWRREGFGKGGEIFWALPGDARGTQGELHPLA